MKKVDLGIATTFDKARDMCAGSALPPVNLPWHNGGGAGARGCGGLVDLHLYLQ